jgi:large subunit ribosomal protein L32e
MTDKKTLLEFRSKMKKKKPGFFRRNWNSKGKIERTVWRKARGTDNKQRVKLKGYAVKPSQGFRSPAEVRGLHKSGLLPIIISSIKQLDSLTREHGVILSGRLGDKKRKELIVECQKRKITIINLDAEKAIGKIDASIKQRQDNKKKRSEEESAKAEKQKKSIEEKLKKEKKEKQEKESAAPVAAPSEGAEPAEDEKKKLENEEKAKVLTKKM